MPRKHAETVVKRKTEEKHATAGMKIFSQRLNEEFEKLQAREMAKSGKRLSKASLSRQMNYETSGTISMWTTDATKVPGHFEKLYRLAKRMGVTVESLFGDVVVSCRLDLLLLGAAIEEVETRLKKAGRQISGSEKAKAIIENYLARVARDLDHAE